MKTVICINRADFKGHDVINVRVFGDAGGGDMKPGKPGVAFRAALLSDVMAALAHHVATEGAD